MSSYAKVFEGQRYILHSDMETTKLACKKQQVKDQKLGYKTRIVKTKNGFSRKVGYSLFIRKKSLLGKG